MCHLPDRSTSTLSEPLAAGSPMPSITPSVGGSWSLSSPTTLTFQPTQSMIPFDSYTVNVPGGPNGLRGASGDHLAASVHIKFKVAAGLLPASSAAAREPELSAGVVHSLVNCCSRC